MKRHTQFFLNDIKSLDFCGNNLGFEASVSAFELPFKTQPTKGKHDYRKCDNCKGMLAKLESIYKAQYNGENSEKFPFPFCCSKHANLTTKNWFDKSKFDLRNIPFMVAQKIILTNQHIINNYDKIDWYEDITDYINYTITSFGQMPENCGEPLFLNGYLSHVTELLLKTGIPENKKIQIVEYIKSYQTGKDQFNTELSELLNTYQNWYKIFPFELSYFSDLKEKFIPTIPKLIFATVPKTNRYSGETYSKIHTKSSLFNALINITNTLLSQVSGAILVEKGLITDSNKIRIELLINERKLKLKRGYNYNPQDDDSRYFAMLEEWFKDEKEFFAEFTQILPALPSPQPEPVATLADKLKPNLTKFGFYELPKVKCLTIEKQNSVIELISSNGLPYAIAMFDYLGFLNHIEINYLPTKYKLNKEISTWFNSDKEGRAVKGNISVLLKNTKEDKAKYTAHLHKETVQKDYNKLK